LIKNYDFKLRNHYKGFEWLIYGIVEESDIIQTVRVSDLQAFARTGRIPHMRDVLQYISQRQHAFGLIDNLHIKPPKTSYHTGQMVGMVLQYLKIPDDYRGVVARKIKTMMKFKHYLSPGRDRAFRKGVYNFDHPDSDSDSDGLDDFVLDSDDGTDSDGTFWDSDLEDLRKIKRKTAVHNSTRSSPESEAEKDSDESKPKAPTRTKRTKVQVQQFSHRSTDKIDTVNEQALLDAQLHATTKQWMTEKSTTTSTHRMLQISHIEVPTLTAEQRSTFKLIKQAPAPPQIIDLTNDTENDDITPVHPCTTNEDVIVVATAKEARARRSMNLAIRSSSVRSTVGLGGGLARLEAHAAAAAAEEEEEFEVMEVLQFD
jgi:hypothetical protein